jgi:UPF0755 protein
MMRGRAIIIAVLALCLALPGWLAARQALLYHRAQPDAEAKIIDIPAGVGLAEATQVLSKAGIVDHPLLFKLAARLTARHQSIKAGEYRLSAAMSYDAILETLHRGRVLMHVVMLPEGFTLEQMVERLAQTGLVDRKKALDLASDQEFLHELGIQAGSLEGYLFPDTYRFAKGLSARAILGRMFRRFQSAWQPLAPAAKEAGLSRLQAVTLASIIERETSLDAERPLVSAVYHNRLKRKMPLQADPTVIYGMDDFDGNLTKADLHSDNPYNTYTRTGLPPGPICSPGRASLFAAVHPAKADYLYFVAKGDGSHHFSAVYREHVNAVNRYQKKQRR